MSTIHVEELDERHLEDASELVASRYKVEREQTTILPKIYEEKRSFLPSLRDLLKRASGVAAVKGGELVGFLLGITIPSFKSPQKGAFCPEWAHVAVGPGKRRIYQLMYEKISSRWIESGCFTHGITVFAHDSETIDTWFWSNFGLETVDAIRDLSPLNGSTSSEWRSGVWVPTTWT